MTKQKSQLPLDVRLVMAVTEYDRKLEAKGDVNIYRLGIILKGLDAVHEGIAEGKSVARALYDSGFHGRLLSALEKAAGVALTYRGGGKDRGRPE